MVETAKRYWIQAMNLIRPMATAPAPSTLLKMIAVEGGTFQMGSNKGESNEQPVHQVTVSSFFMADTPTTQSQYLAVMGSHRSYHRGSSLPVEMVSWYDAVEFCNDLSLREGLTPAYLVDQLRKDPLNINSGDEIKWSVSQDRSANGYRLPTEAEWEYAARGGARSGGYRYAGSHDLHEVGWYEGNARNTTHPVRQKNPNELGLYDMSGNVWEWCWDWYGNYPVVELKDPTGPNVGRNRVLRGGGWGGNAVYAHVSNRIDHQPYFRNGKLGIRVVRNAPNLEVDSEWGTTAQ